MDKKVIICIGRQMGSGGKEVAELLGKRLGVQVFDHELLVEAARESGISPELFEKADEQAKRKSGYLGGNLFTSGSHSVPTIYCAIWRVSIRSLSQPTVPTALLASPRVAR